VPPSLYGGDLHWVPCALRCGNPQFDTRRRTFDRDASPELSTPDGDLAEKVASRMTRKSGILPGSACLFGARRQFNPKSKPLGGVYLLSSGKEWIHTNGVQCVEQLQALLHPRCHVTRLTKSSYTGTEANHLLSDPRTACPRERADKLDPERSNSFPHPF